MSSRDRQFLNRESGRNRRRLSGHTTAKFGPAEHCVDQRLLGPFDDRFGGNALAISHDRHAIAKLENLIEVVGDENDRQPLAAQIVYNRVKLPPLRSTESGRRFIQYQDAMLGLDRAHNFQQLLVSDQE